MTNYRTERLILTAPRPEHETELFKLHNDPLVQQAVFNNVPQSPEDVRKWLDGYLIHWRTHGFGVWMVYEYVNDDPIFIGRCGLRNFGTTNNLELATSLSKQARGRGLAAEASRFAVTHALEKSSKEKVVALITPGNVRAARGTKKFGLRYVDDRWYYDRVWQYYEMTREEYFSQSNHMQSKPG